MADPGGEGYYDQSSLVTGDAVVLDLRPAGFATRMLALFIDVAVQGALLLGMVLVVFQVGAGMDPAVTAAVQVGLMVLILVGYPTMFETLSRGRSLGKLTLGLRVVGTDGSPERFRQALGRALTGAVEIWIFSGVPALITSLINRDGRRIGDFVGGTLVVSERAGRKREETIPMPPRLAEWASTAELSRLTPESASMARQYIVRFSELTEQARYEMGLRIADVVSQAVSPPPPQGTPPPEFLAAVLAERRRREEQKYAQRQGWPQP